ncbi:MAG: enoyl-CoA hydratase/isomerase family protein [Alphaproteobacteria bacterium]|nr:enoyl-CoA hydratase/isomerase family protein [Alphaproteobacteria bacterium]
MTEPPSCSSLTGDSEGIVFVIEGGVAAVTIDREDDQNRMTSAALQRLLALARALTDDAAVQAVIVSGSGQSYFSTGLLNPVLRGSMTKEEVVALVRLANRAFDALDALPQIVIAAINGAVRAGAVELALACDIRLAAQHATLAMPEALWGGFPGAGAPVRLPAIVGRARALELICTGREIDAQEMLQIGFAQSLHPAADLIAQARGLAFRIASAGPLAVRGTKRIVRLRTEPGLAAARELSDALRNALEWSEDVAEGIAAHRENRTPSFRGR